MSEREQTYAGPAPTNLCDCIAALRAHLSDEDAEKIKTTSLDEFRTTAHFGLGLEIRNSFLLPENSPLAAYFKGKGVFHVDDNAGMRLGEILGLKVEDVDFQKGLIHVRTSKSGEGRKIPTNAVLTKVLTEVILPRRFGEYVFFNSQGKPYKDVRKACDKALKASGLDCRFHDLRHTFASNLVMAGIDIVTVKELLGHKTIAMTMRYPHLSDGHKKSAVEALSVKSSH